MNNTVSIKVDDVSLKIVWFLVSSFFIMCTVGLDLGIVLCVPYTPLFFYIFFFVLYLEIYRRAVRLRVFLMKKKRQTTSHHILSDDEPARDCVAGASKK